MRKFALLAAAALAATTVAAPAWAEISITDMQQVSQGETIQFPVQSDGSSVIGFTNQTNTSVTFTTLSGQTLDTPSQGQARIQAVSGSTVVPLSSLLINLTAPNTTFGYIEFNLFGGTQLADATSVTIHALDALGNPFDLVVPIGNGENFFSALATNGERIASISFNSGNTTGVTDIRQIRINLGENLQAVPEPATWAMMLLGFGAAGMAMRRTRRRKGLLAQIA